MTIEDFDYESPVLEPEDVEADVEGDLEDTPPEPTVRLRRVQSTVGVVKDLDTGRSYDPRGFFEEPQDVAERLLAIRRKGNPVFVLADS